jgi:ribonuclease VapC
MCDSSAVVAVMLREPGWEAIASKLAADPAPAVSAPTLVEVGIVLTAKLRRDAGPLVARFLQEAGLDVIPFSPDHWRVAVEAYARYGKGRHAAALNFGDCLVYAVTKLAGQPLLCVGADFAKTDLPVA